MVGKVRKRVENNLPKDLKFVYNDSVGSLSVERGGEVVLSNMVKYYPIVLINRYGEVKAKKLASELFGDYESSGGVLPKYKSCVLLSNRIVGRVVSIKDIGKVVRLEDGTTVKPMYYVYTGYDYYFADLKTGVFWYGTSYIGPEGTTWRAFVLDPNGKDDPAMIVAVVKTKLGRVVCLGDTPVAVVDKVVK